MGCYTTPRDVRDAELRAAGLVAVVVAIAPTSRELFILRYVQHAVRPLKCLLSQGRDVPFTAVSATKPTAKPPLSSDLVVPGSAPGLKTIPIW